MFIARRMAEQHIGTGGLCDVEAGGIVGIVEIVDCGDRTHRHGSLATHELGCYATTDVCPSGNA